MINLHWYKKTTIHQISTLGLESTKCENEKSSLSPTSKRKSLVWREDWKERNCVIFNFSISIPPNVWKVTCVESHMCGKSHVWSLRIANSELSSSWCDETNTIGIFELIYPKVFSHGATASDSGGSISSLELTVTGATQRGATNALRKDFILFRHLSWSSPHPPTRGHHQQG